MNQGVASTEAIQIEAYILSEIAGHPPGMEHIFWRQAEALVRSRLAAGISKPATPRAKTGRVAKPVAPTAGKSVEKTPSPKARGGAVKKAASGELFAEQPAPTPARKRRS